MDLSQLNEPQRMAAETTQGPVLILAGAGSGKTRALTYRIAHLIDTRLASPYEILALTFTNKAAREMRERIESLIGSRAADMWVMTFHSACARILRYDGELLGYTKQFVIYDDSDQMSVVKECLDELRLSDEEYPKRLVKSIISDAKNRSLDPLKYLKETQAEGSREAMVPLFKRYEDKLKSRNAMDFDDLLHKALKLFKEHPEVLQKYQQRFRYLHIDEYQDTNLAQYQFVRLLAAGHGNICVVGDDDQSIYGWRGADIRNILEFEKDFGNATVLRLEQNYRSTAAILEAANAVIHNNKGRKAKALWTESGKGEPITRVDAFNEREEADYVCREIAKNVREGASYSDFAVLYRMNAQSRILEGTLGSYGIPYVVHGGMKFYDRREIKDIIAYLRVLENPADDVSLLRILNVPKRGLGEAAEAEIIAHAQANEQPLFSSLLDFSAFSGRISGKLRAVGELFSVLLAYKETLPLGEFVEKVVEQTGYWEYLQTDKKEDALQRQENVREFLTAAHEFAEDNVGNEDASLTLLLESLALASDVDNLEENAGAVTLMTLHSAKGLEFSSVFILGMEEYVFPHARAMNSESEMEEERRLCYVGITRAMRKLYLTRVLSRMTYGRSGGFDIMKNPPSRFLKEIPEALYASVDGGFALPQQPVERMTASAVRHQAQKDRAAMWTAQTQQPRARERKPSQAYQVSQKVMHGKFGAGNISNVHGSGDKITLTIEFADYGVKHIVPAYAPLEIIE